ncbi:MAG TPA: hypothetical protein DCX54_13465 [Flavobacteriales bacterium]|nr:hypothetical protein [Flavobacteriales bacterium]
MKSNLIEKKGLKFCRKSTPILSIIVYDFLQELIPIFDIGISIKKGLPVRKALSEKEDLILNERCSVF